MQMFGPKNGVCNYLELEKIYGMLILRIRAFSPPELYGGGEGGSREPQGPRGYTPDSFVVHLRGPNRESIIMPLFNKDHQTSSLQVKP